MRRILQASVRTQIALLTMALAIAVTIISISAEPFVPGRFDKGMQIGILAGRIDTIVGEFQEAKTAGEEENVIERARRKGLHVERATRDQLAQAAALDTSAAASLRQHLDVGIFHDPAHFFNSDLQQQVYVSGDAEKGLAFALPEFLPSRWILPAVMVSLAQIVLPAALLAYLCAWIISRPLVRFAAAAERTSMDDAMQEPFRAEGASEIRSLATSLNVMRKRVLNLIAARTRMLTSISHDLRTPLTRLRMRAERCEKSELKQQMLRDIEMLAGMIDESLGYLSNSIEETRKVELSSLLQKVADDFVDTGVAVTFEGPRRLAYECKPRSMSRAVSNLIDNASRLATQIDVTLAREDNGTVVITVADNGPGLTDDLKKQVLEPFFKADEARPVSKGSGFGLGFPIVHAIITTSHGGAFELIDREPVGLVAVIKLPPTSSNRH